MGTKYGNEYIMYYPEKRLAYVFRCDEIESGDIPNNVRVIHLDDDRPIPPKYKGIMDKLTSIRLDG